MAAKLAPIKDAKAFDQLVNSGKQVGHVRGEREGREKERERERER